ncbi:pex11 domain containing protein [Stylonychia lemnae]|uniref:Pex11 domain containing protein n=1 Tax=Stylonychia lemnae TaxID=5949 RepID=A0A078AFJ1_STYLE|nr:pex11 domain containing protein [Stylonychia lemnae]|eukprot:CDW81009.1 pex11 domain containing protein [Stylonychia lemnae]
MKHSISGINLAVKQTPVMMKNLGNVMAYEVMQLSNVMSSSRGRDKICALIQYIVQLYVNCMKYSQEYHDLVELNEISSVLIGRRVVDQISSGRKVFKFLKFVDEIKNVVDLFGKKGAKNGQLVRIMSLFARVCGFFYYLLDNVVWFSNMGMISKTAFNKMKWKRLKDIFTLAKNWSEVIKSIIIWYYAVQEENRINEELSKLENQVVGLDQRTTKLVKDLIKQRQKRRICFATVIQNTLRILMLSYRLKLPIKKYMHPIFYTVCGLVSNIFAIFKIWSNESSKTYSNQKLVRLSDMKKKAAQLQIISNQAQQAPQANTSGRSGYANHMIGYYESNQKQLELTNKLHKVSRGNLLKIKSDQSLNNVKTITQTDEDRSLDSLDSYRDEPYPFMDNCEAQLKRDRKMQRVRSKYSNVGGAAEVDSDEDELYDKNVKNQKNYKLFTLREKSVLDFNQMSKMEDNY